MNKILLVAVLSAICQETALALSIIDPGGLQPMPSVFCGAYPCKTYNVNGDCTSCDCTGVTCGANQKLGATCGCTACAGCSNCMSDLSWTDIGVGYVKRTSRICNCETCRVSTEYSCAMGFYGTTYDGTSGCTLCAIATGDSNATSWPGSNSSITDCYIPAGKTYSDASGTWQFDQKCNYKQ